MGVAMAARQYDVIVIGAGSTGENVGPTTMFSQQEGACAYDAVTQDTSINRSLHDGGF